MEAFFAENISVLFVLALFYAAVSGIDLTISLRVALVYSLSCLAILYSVVERSVILTGTAIVLF